MSAKQVTRREALLIGFLRETLKFPVSGQSCGRFRASAARSPQQKTKAALLQRSAGRKIHEARQ